MVKNYTVYVPEAAGRIEDEWEQCLAKIRSNFQSGNIPVKLNIFVNQPDYSSYVTVKKHILRSILDSFPGRCPAVNVSIHPPAGNCKVGAEEVSVNTNEARISSKFWKSVPYVVLENGPYKEVWGAGLGDDLYENDTRKAATAAFESVIGILEQENLTMNNLVRQWNYIGDILKIRDGFQNYQIFNEVRSEFYSRYRTGRNFPAATGIGMKYGGVFLDFCAVEAHEELQVKGVGNPNQVNPYEYGQNVLQGLTGRGKPAKHPPQFERALLMVNSESRHLFISGTASIIGQETRGKGDIREQTLVTIENINKLTDSEYLRQLLGTPDLVTGRYTLLRVYVKQPEHFDEVKEICSSHFPGVPAIYIQADICREDLLTEIEAEFLL